MDDANVTHETSWPDPWNDPHDIEYWVWNGERLMPASPAEQATIQEMERAQSARRHQARRERTQYSGSIRLRIALGRSWGIERWRHLWRHARPAASSRQRR